ncbi:MAG TPA: hypothetical protein VF121_09080 [Thermoanaerobaculia bacterium]|nr:hypothetical protein [Thermoanaerobaculia bacterium]
MQTYAYSPAASGARKVRAGDSPARRRRRVAWRRRPPPDLDVVRAAAKILVEPL